MKAFVFSLSAICLAKALHTVVDIPRLDHASAVASHVLSSQTHAQVVESRNDQSSTNTPAAGAEAHVGFVVKHDSVPDNITETTDKYLFHLSIKKFEARRDSRHPPTLDWSSDGCTKAPDDIGRWNFLPACHRHDFGLRNYREQGRLNKKTKRLIDDQFLRE